MHAGGNGRERGMEQVDATLRGGVALEEQSPFAFHRVVPRGVGNGAQL